jgi:hypothetical protein
MSFLLDTDTCSAQLKSGALIHRLVQYSGRLSIEETFASMALETIADWILARTRERAATEVTEPTEDRTNFSQDQKRSLFSYILQVLSVISVSSVADERGWPQFATLIPWPDFRPRLRRSRGRGSRHI